MGICSILWKSHDGQVMVETRIGEGTGLYIWGGDFPARAIAIRRAVAKTLHCGKVRQSPDDLVSPAGETFALLVSKSKCRPSRRDRVLVRTANGWKSLFTSMFRPRAKRPLQAEPDVVLQSSVMRVATARSLSFSVGRE